MLCSPDRIPYGRLILQARRACCLRLQDPEQGIIQFDPDRGKELLSKEDLHLIRNHLNARTGKRKQKSSA